MLKKIFKGFMVVSLVFSSLFASTACGKDDNEHPLTKAELSALYKEVALETWESLGVSDPTVSSAALLANVVDKKTETTDENQIENIKVNAASMAGIVYMVSLLYANENFETTNNIAVFDADITMGSQTYTQSYILDTSIDKGNNKVYLQTLMTVNGATQYSNLVMDYNFETKTLVSYRFFTNVDVMNTYVDMALTADSKYMWYGTISVTDEFAITVETEKTALTTASSNVTKLTTNFSNEIQVYMDVLQEAIEDMDN